MKEHTSDAGAVMVLSAAVGAGHVKAAEALTKVFHQRGIPAHHIEVLRFTNPVFKKVYANLYLDLVNLKPELLGWMYNSLDRPWRFQKRRLALDRLNTAPFVKLIRNKHPRAALCTHFLPPEILLHLKRKEQMHIPVGIVVTDFDAHALWLFRDADWYFVACEETRVYLTEIGIPEDTIHVTGIPVDPLFRENIPKAMARQLMGLDRARPVILVSAGGFGVGPVEDIIQVVQKVTHPVQVVVICGKNEKLKKRLSHIAYERHPVTVVGFTDEMHRWMAASDLLVGKPGGLTSSEALASNLIMVIVNPVPGQEERNSDHLLEEGVAIRCNNLPALAYKIDDLLNDKTRMNNMLRSISHVRRPDAAEHIVSIMMNKETSIKRG